VCVISCISLVPCCHGDAAVNIDRTTYCALRYQIRICSWLACNAMTADDWETCSIRIGSIIGWRPGSDVTHSSWLTYSWLFLKCSIFHTILFGHYSMMMILKESMIYCCGIVREIYSFDDICQYSVKVCYCILYWWLLFSGGIHYSCWLMTYNALRCVCDLPMTFVL